MANYDVDKALAAYREDSGNELTRLREENARLREALNKIADYSPGSTVQPALIAREALKVPS